MFIAKGATPECIRYSIVASSGAPCFPYLATFGSLIGDQYAFKQDMEDSLVMLLYKDKLEIRAQLQAGDIRPRSAVFCGVCLQSFGLKPSRRAYCQDS
jgi:hypothetical protein